MPPCWISVTAMLMIMTLSNIYRCFIFIMMLPMLKTERKVSLAEEILLHLVENVPIGLNPLTELGLQYNSDEDYEELKRILTTILHYPSTDLARLHKNSNKLGILDHKQNSSVIARLNLSPQDDQSLVHCSCCAFPLQKKQIPFCTPLQDVNNIGISTHLYFQTLINLSLQMAVMFLIYGIFALVTNVIAAQAYQPDDPAVNAHQGILIISLGAKKLNATQENNHYYVVQCWLGVVTVFVWGLLFMFIKYFEKDREIFIEGQTKSASDFTVMLHEIPTDLTQQELQKQLDKYYDTIDPESIPTCYKDRFNIKKFNIAKPFYLHESSISDQSLDTLNDQYEQKIDMFCQWILERRTRSDFSVPKKQRQAEYEEFQRIKQAKAEKYEQLIEQFVERMKNQEEEELTTTAFVTFDTNHAKELFLYLNGRGILNILRNVFCCWDKYHFHLEYEGKERQIKVRKSPEPEDIRWTNMGQTTCVKVLRKSITYLITIVILAGSFGIIYVLNEEQVKNEQNTLISLGISVALVAINSFMLAITRALTILERQFTETSFHTSLAIKSIISQLANAIVIPAIVNVLIEKNIYNMNGLSFDTLTLCIINSFSFPLIKMIQPPYILMRVKSWWYKKPQNKLKLNQEQLNNLLELIPFDLGYEYIYIVMNFLFICYFTSLQPILPIFGILGFLWMYWAQKYSIFYRMQRPIPGNDMVNTAMHQLIYMGPLVFTLGNLTWSSFLGGGPDEALAPNIISLALSFILAVFPYQIIFTKMFEDKISKRITYQATRICLPSEYDRLNPSTSSEAIEQYLSFVKTYQENTKQDFQNVKELIINQSQKGYKKLSEIMPFFVNVAKNGKFLPKDGKSKNVLGKYLTSLGQTKQSKPKQFYRTIGTQKKSKQVNFIQNWTKVSQRKPEGDLTFLKLIKSTVPVNQNENSKIKPIEEDSMEQLFADSSDDPYVLIKANVIRIGQTQKEVDLEGSKLKILMRQGERCE